MAWQAGFDVTDFILKPAVERGAEAQLIQPSGLTQKPQLTHRVSLHFCASPFIFVQAHPAKAVALCIHAQLPDLGSSSSS